MRVVVVGASSGLGRCIAVGLARRGERVAVLARRYRMLEEVVGEAGPEALAVACDVTDETSCRGAIEEAATKLGGIDGLVYASGVGPLRRLVDTDMATWRQALETNVIGASLATASAIGALTDSRGVAVYLSSVSASVTPPWPGLGAYAVSKAALDKLIEAWRIEHPRVGFTRIVVGDCAGGQGDAMSQLPSAWDVDLASELFPVWSTRNYLSGSVMDVDNLVNVVDTVLRCGADATVSSVSVVPRSAEGAQEGGA